MLRLSTQAFVAELRMRGYTLSPSRATIWAAQYPGLAIRFGQRWTFDPRAVPLLCQGIAPEEVGTRLLAADETGEAA